MKEHVVQSPEWGRFKTEYGTKAYKASGIQYTIHKIPLTNYFYAYAPKVNNFDIDWENLEDSLNENNCIAINFDVPNILTNENSEEANRSMQILKEKCVKSPKDTFAKHNILLDISTSEEILLKNMNKKNRYNIRYAQRKGVTTRMAEDLADFEIFYDLMNSTAERQKYYIHPKVYYEKIWKLLNPLDMCHIVFAEYQETPLAAWMLFVYKKVLYYPYGGSSEEYKNLFGSNLVGWEAIQFGKSMGCKTFDMWGAAPDPTDESHPWYGFTNFKMKYGGNHVTYIDSYDFVINSSLYNMFNFANDLRWKILKTLK